jgi:lysophospholipase L1-like esterase
VGFFFRAACSWQLDVTTGEVITRSRTYARGKSMRHLRDNFASPGTSSSGYEAMKPTLFVSLIAIVWVGCSNQNDGEPGADTDAGQSGWGGQAAVGGQNAVGGQVALGGSNAMGGQAGAGGQIGGGTASAAGTSAGGSASQGSAANQGGAPGSGGAFGPGGFSGAGGTPATYAPCPTDGSPCKILPFGDSITWGVGDEANAGYRGPLFAMAVAAQQKITFTGSLSNGPDSVVGQTFPKRNEGHSGYGISTVTQFSNGVAGIATLIPSPAFASGAGGLPNVILMMIGTNDTGNSTAAEMADRLGALMDKIIVAAPDALLVVAKITPLSWATAIINSYNDDLAGLVQTRAAAGKHMMLADMNTGFTSTMIGSDGIHPNTTGYKFMADRWYSVVGPLLPR